MLAVQKRQLKHLKTFYTLSNPLKHFITCLTHHRQRFLWRVPCISFSRRRPPQDVCETSLSSCILHTLLELKPNRLLVCLKSPTDQPTDRRMVVMLNWRLWPDKLWHKLSDWVPIHALYSNTPRLYRCAPQPSGVYIISLPVFPIAETNPELPNRIKAFHSWCWNLRRFCTIIIQNWRWCCNVRALAVQHKSINPGHVTHLLLGTVFVESFLCPNEFGAQITRRRRPYM